jgi:hypothetical protein
MRRPITYPLLLASLLAGLLLLGAPLAASAAPTVTVHVKVVPIPGFPHTGYIPGHGAAVEIHTTIAGTEYGGFPPPLIGVNAYLPKGVKVHPQGFPVCPLATLEKTGRCPRASQAGPAGHALGVVSFGSERVPEEVSIQPYLSSGGLEFYVQGHSPVALELISKGHFVPAHGLFDEQFIGEVPLVETVPGAPDASTEFIDVTIGTAIKRHGKTIYYGVVPKTCPRGGYPVKSELIFAALGGLPPQTVTTSLKIPCPKK